MATLKSQKSRKVYVCSKCQAVIEKGVTYFRFSVSRFQKLKIRCIKCKPTRQDMTNSEFMSQVFDIDDAIKALTIEEMDNIEAAIEPIKSDLENLQNETEDRHSNMPEHLQDSSSSGQMLTERIDAVGEMIDALDCVELEIDGADEMDEDELLDAKNDILLSIQAVEYQGP